LFQKASSELLSAAISRVSPVYPEEAKPSRASGSVTAEIIINEAGSVESVRVMSGPDVFRKATIDAIQQWKFSPFATADSPVKVVGTLTFYFSGEQGLTTSITTEEDKQRAFSDGEKKGYTQGREDGYNQGTKDATAKAYNEGVEAGKKAAEAKANTLMENVRQWLAWIFGSVFYPLIVVGIFLYIIGMIAIVIAGGKGAGRIRRSVGAILPLLILVFLVVTGQDKDNPIAYLFGSISPLIRFIVGAITGFLLMEAGKFLLDIDNEISSSLYALFLSGLGAFLVWSIMGGVLPIINIFLFGLVLAGCLHVIFRGPPEI